MSPGSGISLDPWFDNYAERASGLTASEVRALFAVASRPEVVSLAGGMPFVSALSLIKSAPPHNGFSPITEQVLCSMAQVKAYPGFANAFSTSWRWRAFGQVWTTLSSPPGRSRASTWSRSSSSTPAMRLSPNHPVMSGLWEYFAPTRGSVEHVAMDEWGMIPHALVERIASLREAGTPIKISVPYS